MPKRAVKLGPDAVRQFKALQAAERARLKVATLAALGDDNAEIENQNRCRLRRPSGQFEFEFRDSDLRVFYRIEDDQMLAVFAQFFYLDYGCSRCFWFTV